MKYSYTLNRTAKFKKRKNKPESNRLRISHPEEYMKHIYTVWGGVNQCDSLVWHYLLKRNMCTPYNPAMTPENK